MLERKGMPVSGTKSELIYRLQNADDAESEVVKETKKNMEREYGLSISVDKVREILVSYILTVYLFLTSPKMFLIDEKLGCGAH